MRTFLMNKVLYISIWWSVRKTEVVIRLVWSEGYSGWARRNKFADKFALQIFDNYGILY